jgi:ADP-heptose:LPS heptosyltransferase
VNIHCLKLIDALLGGQFVSLFRKPILDNTRIRLNNIIIFRPGGIGDAVLLIPAINILKANYHSLNITILAEKRNAGVFELCPAIDKLLLYDRPVDLFNTLKYKYDIVIDSEQWHRLSAVVARLTGAQVIIGFGTNERGRLFTHSIPYVQDLYETENFMRLLEPLNVQPPVALTPYLTVPPKVAATADTLLQELMGMPFVALFPGASIPTRRWGAVRFAAVAAGIAAAGYGVVVVGGREDVESGATITRAIDAVNIAGKTSLVETAAVIARSELLVSGDSGVLHLAVGLGVPTVSLFGPGIADKWAPQGDRHVVLTKNLPCSPCTRFGYTPRCPINAECLRLITPAEVTEAVLKLLKN